MAFLFFGSRLNRDQQNNAFKLFYAEDTGRRMSDDGLGCQLLWSVDCGLEKTEAGDRRRKHQKAEDPAYGRQAETGGPYSR